MNKVSPVLNFRLKHRKVKTIQWFPAKLETVTVLSNRLICFSVADPNVCPDLQLLQFPSRYLEWIMVAREHSLDPTFNLDFNARADSLTEDERQEVLSVRTWFLCNHDLRRPQRIPGRALLATSSRQLRIGQRSLDPQAYISSLEWTTKNT